MKQNPKPAAKFPIERSVWHGTSNDAVSSIQIHGFNRSYAGDKNGKHGHYQNAVTVTYTEMPTIPIFAESFRFSTPISAL